MTDIVSVLNLINYGFVLIFGIIVSFYFAGIQWEDNKRLFILTTVLFVLFQALFYVLLGENVLFKCYPVLIHIPLILIIRYICHQNIYISFIAVMSAYLMCTPRKWFGTLAKYIFPEIPVISDVVTIVITIPLLIVVIKYISPYIIKLKEESKNIISMFFLLPLTYYILEYALTVYTNLLYTGKAVIIEFMDSFIVVLYFFLSIVTLSMSNKKNTAERENIILSAAAAQAEKEISQLTDYQKQAAIYRHDLRHHMNFIQSCLAGNNMQQALEYINEINNNTKLIDNVYVSLQNIFEWPSNANSNSDGYCLGGKSHIGILSDGSVIICCLDGEGESNLGNIFYEDLSFILNSEKYHNIINYFKNNKCYLDICKKCTYKNRFK